MIEYEMETMMVFYECIWCYLISIDTPMNLNTHKISIPYTINSYQ